jgi:hypothetical protein
MVTLIEPDPYVVRLAQKIDAAFIELPTLRLTAAQARRLWSLSPERCAKVLDYLVEMGHLTRDDDGQYEWRRRS